MAIGNTPCGIAIPQDFINRPVDMPYIQQFVQKAATLSSVAALTTTPRLGTSVMLLVRRNPVQLAKSLSSLDQMCQGRLDVGIGMGGHVREAIFGLPTEHRIRRFVEAIQVMKALWTAPKASVHGTFWQFEHTAMAPPSLCSRRIRRYGSGHARRRRCSVPCHTAMAGMGAGSSSTLAIDNDRDRAEQRLRAWFGVRYRNADMAPRVSIWGSQSEGLDKLGARVKAGAQHLMLNPVFDEMDYVEQLAAEVMLHL